MDRKQILLLAGGSAAAAAVLWYLLKEKSSGEQKASLKAGAKKPEDITRDETVEILKEIESAQAIMKKDLRTLTQELAQKPMSFDAVYDKVKQVQPKDPLECHGLTMKDLDTCLERFSGDEAIRQLVTKVMGVSGHESHCSNSALNSTDRSDTGSSSQSIDVAKLIAIHKFMLQELESTLEACKQNPRRETFDHRAIAITVQVIVGQKVQEKFGAGTEDIESAVIRQHGQLGKSQEFGDVNTKIQQVMSQLIALGSSS
eukprot:TRINITY_DN5812_c0_g1_i1.p1 TRINITY_DN5812_c0_g1~~TRINITY_DN5812_c0_g1_i1.p1  ORF type:complete len:258 (-),score=58.67 TRINITY_DN5812_c0_g1_i1:47-820(-)